MGLDYSVQAGYGFFVADSYAWDLPALLGKPGYELDGFPDEGLLEELGYSGIEILENPSNSGPEGWAICAEVTSFSIDPKSDTGIWDLEEEPISDQALASLIVARKQLFPDTAEEDLPKIGWFLMAGIY